MKLILSLFFLIISAVYAEYNTTTKVAEQKQEMKAEQKVKKNAFHEFDALPAVKRVEYVELRKKADESMKRVKPFTALLALQEAEAIFTKDAHLHYLKGYMYSSIHDYERARKCYMKALSYNENHINSLMNLVELNFYLKDYKKAIYWYTKTTDVIGKKTSPLLEFKYFIAITKLSKKNKTYEKLRGKIVQKYSYMDDNPYYYYALAVERYENGDKTEFFDWVKRAVLIFNDVSLIKHWNKALEDSSYLLPSDLVLKPNE